MDISTFLSAASKEQRLQSEIERLVRIAGWRDKPFMMGLLKLCLRSGNMEPMIEQLKRRFESATRFHPFEDVPSPDAVGGEISIGNLVLPDWTIGCAVGINPEHLPTHILICGPSGKGKTILARFLALQIVDCGIPILVPDTEESFEDLPLYAPGRILTFDVSKGEFKRNIWQPLPGETFMDTESRLRDMFREVWVGEGGINILSEVAIELQKENGLFTITQFYERLKKMRSRRGLDWRRGQYLESLINRVSNLVNHLSAGYEVLEGYPLDEMLAVSMVLKMQNLSNDINVFFVVELLSAISDLKMRQRAESLPLVAIIDEAQRFLEAAEYSGTVVGSPAMFDIIATLRKRNAGLLLATQLVSKLPDVVLGNVATQIFFQTLDGDSISKIGKSLSLTQDQQKFLPELPKRCVLMRHPNFPKPFLVKIPELNLERTATEEQIAEMMAPILASLKWKPSPFTNGVNGREAVRANPIERNVASDDADYADKTETTDRPEKQIKSEVKGLGIELLDYIRAIADDQFVPSTIRDEKLKLSAGTGFARRSELLKLGLICEVKVPTGVRGGQVTLLDITSAGRDLLARHHIKLNAKGKGGLKHQYFQNVMQRWFAENYTVGEATIEDATSGKAVDVAFVDGEKRIAVEILVNGIDKELSNIESDIQSFDEIWLVAESKEQSDRLAEKVRASFDADEMNRIRFELIGKFISELGGNESNNKNKKKQHK